MRGAVLCTRLLLPDVRRFLRSSFLYTGLAALAIPHMGTAADHTFTVNTTADGVDANPGDGVCATSGGLCTLRAAVMESNHTASGTVEIIVPANASPYVLTIPPSGLDGEESGDLNIDRGVTITGAGAAHTIIDGNGTDRVFLLLLSDATISGLTIRNGSADYGGGIYSEGDDFSTLTLSRCVVSANTAAYDGGGIKLQRGTVILDRLAVSGNTATTGVGGGIERGSASLTIADSTISGNSAHTAGGGIYNNGSTIGSISILYSTIAGNTVGSYVAPSGSNGGGIYGSGLTSVTITGTIIGINFAWIPTSPYPTLDYSDCDGVFAGSANLVNTKTGCTITAAEMDPKLGPLQLNGGQVPTRALLSGSPAINAGNPTACAFKTPTDGRGAYRPEGSACDIGAYEYAANGDVNGDGVRDVADIFYLINFLFAGGPAPVGLGDVNGDTKTDAADVFFMINFLFAGGAAPL
jgi:CSLREA domain-containing protein